tara:strand:- start:147 stop:791 length:645 start_codon:yes stop_codon:yes gene_type:complete
MKLNYFLKKIENLIIKKSFNYPKTIIDYFNNNEKTTVLSFSSIGRGRKYVQQNEFFYLTKKYNVLFIKDITRSWFNNIDIKYIKSFLKKNNYAIGFSMGAFNAIIFSTLYPIKKLIAFSPQFSIHPKISEDDTFLNFAAKIKKWKYNKLKFSKNTKYLLIFGDNNKEKYHMSMIPKQKNIKIIVLKNCDHNTALHLKKKGDLEKIINKFFNDNS